MDLDCFHCLKSFFKMPRSNRSTNANNNAQTYSSSIITRYGQRNVSNIRPSTRSHSNRNPNSNISMSTNLRTNINNNLRCTNATLPTTNLTFNNSGNNIPLTTSYEVSNSNGYNSIGNTYQSVSNNSNNIHYSMPKFPEYPPSQRNRTNTIICSSLLPFPIVKFIDLNSYDIVNTLISPHCISKFVKNI